MAGLGFSREEGLGLDSSSISPRFTGLGFAPEPTPAPSPAAPARAPQLDVLGTPGPRQPAPLANLSTTQKIGALLQDFGRGIAGRKSYTQELLEQRSEQDALELKRMDVGINAMTKGMELLKNTPAGQREAIAKQYGQLYEHLLPGFTETLSLAAQQPEATETQLKALGEHAQTLISLGGDINGAMKLAQNPAFMSQLNEAADQRNAPEIVQAFRRGRDLMMQSPETAALWDQMTQDGLTLSDLQDPTFRDALGLSQGHVNTIARDTDIQEMLRPVGFIPLGDSKLAAEQRIKADANPPAGTKVMREVNGKKVASFINPKTGREMFSIPTGIAAGDGGKVTGADIKAAVALRLAGKDPAGSGLPAGAIAATDGLDEKQLMSLGGQLAGGGISIRQTKDGLEVVTGSAANFRERSAEKAAEAERQTTAATLKLINLGDRVKEMAAAEPNSTNFGGTMARTIDNFTADVVGAASLVGYDVRKNLGLPANDPNKLTTLNAAEAPDALFGNLANRSAAFKTAVFNLALAAAAANGQEGKGLSDKDLALFIQQVGGNVSSIGQLESRIDEIQRQAYDNLRIDYQVRHYDPERDATPAFPTLDELKRRATGKPAATADGAALLERALNEGVDKLTPDERATLKAYRESQHGSGR